VKKSRVVPSLDMEYLNIYNKTKTSVGKSSVKIYAIKEERGKNCKKCELNLSHLGILLVYTLLNSL